MDWFLKKGWLPPTLELLAAICGYFALRFSAASAVTALTKDGMKPLAAIAVEIPWLGVVALVLLGAGLILQIIQEVKKG